MEINQIHKNVVLTVDPITNVVNIEVTQVISPPVILEVSEVGRKGDQGVKGDTGNDGLSAYQIAINNGTFVGTELEFATMLGSIDEKLDKGSYTGTAEDLNNELQNLKNPDVVLKSVTPTIEGLNISVPVDSFEWRINQVVFDNTPALSAMLTPASDGFYRKDVLLGTDTNNYLIVEGVEGDESVTPPTVFPEGTILLGNIDIFGNTVGGFSINDTSRTYVYGNGGATDYVEVTKLGTTLEIMNATSLTGFTIPAKNIQYGKDYYLRNSTGGVLTLKSATGTNGIRFYFPDGDMIVPVNNNVHLKYLSNGEFGGLGYFTLVGLSIKGKADKTYVDAQDFLKVDKDGLKQLTDENYTLAEKNKLAELSNFDPTAINNSLANKVDKVTGKSLISDTEITRLSTVVNQDISGKEDSFSKNTAFNKNFGVLANTVSEGNHLHSFSDLQNNPTTIAGYGITDANKSPINVNVTTVRTTAAKIGTTSSGTYTPSIGDRIDVTFTLGTAIANATLNIDGSGVKAIQLAGTNVTALSLSTPASLVVIPMYYNGTAWQIYGSTMSADTNTTYIEATTGLVVTTSTQAVAVNTLYYANNASNVAFTLPTTCAVNSIVHIVGMNSTGTYSVIAPSGDNIILEGNNTGAGGILNGSIGSTLVLICTVANTTWSVVNYTGQIVSNTGYSTNKESTVNKSDSYSVSSTVTYPSTKALVDGLETKEPSFAKNTAFNKNFGTTVGTVAQGNDSRILNGQTAFGWGNHAGLYSTITGSNINQSNFRTALGLGSNAYSSTAYLPLSGGIINGSLTVQNSNYTTFSVKGTNTGNNGGGLIRFENQDTLFGEIAVETESAGNGVIYIRSLTNGAITQKASIASSGAATFSGTVTASPATLPNHVVVKSQLDAVANIAGTSGSYTPSLSNLTNISNSSFDSASYTKIGNVVTARVSLFITAVTPSVTAVLDFLLPVPRVSTNVTGIGLGSSFVASMVVNTNSNTTTARLSYQPLVSTNHQVVVMFQYIVD